MATAGGDYYQVLGVGRGASQQDIQRAYRRLARRFHPDLNSDPGSEERFKQITEAYEVLSDTAKRARYDRFGEARQRAPEDGGARTGPFAGGRPGGRRVRVNTSADPFAGFGGTGIGDVFVGSPFGGDLFSGGLGGFGPIVSAPRADAEAEIEISVEDAYAGGRRRIMLQTATGTQAYDVTIPAGVIDGQRIRLALGAAEPGGRPRGHLYLVVRLSPHPRYRVTGRDITMDLPIAPWEAALGASVPVDTPGGPVQVHIPAGSSSGRRLRLRGHGMPNANGPAGDLYAHVRIVTPPRPSPAERDLWRRLADLTGFDPRADRRAKTAG